MLVTQLPVIPQLILIETHHKNLQGRDYVVLTETSTEIN